MPLVSGDIGIPQIKFGLGLMGHDGFVMGIDLAFGIPLSWDCLQLRERVSRLVGLGQA